MKIHVTGSKAARRARNIFRFVTFMAALFFLLFAIINIAIGNYEDGNLLVSAAYAVISLTITAIPYALSLICQALEDLLRNQ